MDRIEMAKKFYAQAQRMTVAMAGSGHAKGPPPLRMTGQLNRWHF